MADLDIFKNGLIAIEEAKFGGQGISADLNGDGVIDDTERCLADDRYEWQRPRFIRPGRRSDRRGGTSRSDLDVLAAAWTDTAKDFPTALKESGLDQLIGVWQGTALVASVPETPVKAPCR